MFIVVNSFPKSVHAYNYVSISEIKQVVYSNSKKITTSVTSYVNQRGVFNNLKNISLSFLWVKFLHDNTAGITFTEEELNYYYSTSVKKVNAFNSEENNSGDYLKLKLPEPPSNYNSSYFNTLMKSISEYLNKYYSNLKSEYDKLPDENAKVKYLDDLKLTISSSYEILLRLSQDYNYMKTLTISQNSPINLDTELSTISGLLNNGDYKFIYDVAIAQIEKGVNIGGEIELTDSESWIGKFTALDENGTSMNQVNKSYLAILAASSVYKPFQSKVGDEDFIKALSHIVGDNEDIIKAYKELSSLRKPLYLTEYKSKFSWFSSRISPKDLGTGERATLGLLIDRVQGKSSGALVSVVGSFELSEDSDTYVASKKNQVGLATNTGNAGQLVDLDKVTVKDGDEEDSEEEKEDDSKDEKKDDDSKDKSDKDKSNKSSSIDKEGVLSEEALTATVSNTSLFTSPYMVFSKEGLYGDNMILLTNILSDENVGDKIKDNSFYNQILYVNPFGDIVTSDGTVIIPASSNATYYNLDDSVLYNPFTDAFMSNYPNISSMSDFQVSSKDVGKFAVYVNELEIQFIKNIEERYQVTSDKIPSLTAMRIKGEDKAGNAFLFGGDINPIDTGIYDPATGEKYNVFSPVQKKFGFLKSGMASGDSYIYSIDTNTITTESISVALYPYTNASGEELELRNKFIAQCFYASLVVKGDGSEDEYQDNGRLDSKFLLELLTEQISGKKSVIGFEKSVQNELDISGNGNWFLAKIISFFKWISNNVIDLFGSAPGMLGLRSATQDVLMGKFLFYSMKALPYLSIILIIVMLSYYAKNRLNFAYSVFGSALGVLGLFVLIYLAPKHLADITNFLPNNGSNQLAFDSLILRQEVLREKTTVEASYSDFGKFGLAESSVTLYAFTDEQLEEVCKTYEQNLELIMSGSSFVIDEDSGLFVQGSKLKISLDKILNTISINTKSNKDSTVIYYTLDKVENVKSVINYYTPFNVIADGLIKKLNSLSKVYLLNRDQIRYSNNTVKDSFFMRSYIKSPVFVSPLDFKQADDEMDDNTLALLEAYFKDEELGNTDWLGLMDSISSYIDSGLAYKTLWYQTMEQNHYFDEEVKNTLWANLITYVNENTKEFLIKNLDKLDYISDETLVEVTSLYATMLFNTQVSQFYNKLYPERLNYEELSVVDTLRPIITKEYNKFSNQSRDLVDYIYYEYGFFGNMALAIIVLLQGITSLILTYAIFIMYLLLILFVLIRFVIRKLEIRDAIFGFLKLYLILVGVYYVNVLGLQILNNFDSSGLTLFFCLLLSTIVCGMSSSVVLYTITGFATLDFSNGNIAKGYLKALDKLTLGVISGLFQALSSKFKNMNVSSMRVGNDRSSLDRNVSAFEMSQYKYEDSSRVDDYIRRRYDSYKDVNSSEDFYDKPRKFGRASRMKQRVEIDIEDDGDFLA